MRRNIVSVEKRLGRTLRLCALAGLVLAATQVGLSVGSPPSSAAGPQIFTMTTEASGPFPDSFNPFDISTYSGEIGSLIYEPLYQENYDQLKPIPWLATGYAWSNGGKTITLTIRKGIRWSNGQPMTPADVAFTFQLEKNYPSADISGVTIASDSVNAAGQVVVNFTQPSYALLEGILQTTIVPESIWSKISDPVTYQDSNPVGTGPYELKSFSPQVITVTRNPDYWQPHLAKFPEVQAVQEESDSSVEANLETGQLDWTSVEPADANTIVKQHTNLKLENAPFVDAPLIPNFTVYPLNLLAVREAINDALDRPALIKVLAQFYDTPITNRTGLPAASMGQFIAPQYKSAPFVYSPSDAKKVLEQAGFKMGSDGIFNAPDGKPLQIQFLIPSTYDNWVAIAPVMQSELKQAGIGLTIEAIAETTWQVDLILGQFQLSFDSAQYENPYGFYDFYFGTTEAAAVGKPALTDYGRYQNPATDALFDTLSTSAPGSAAATSALDQLEGVMVTQVPIIPLFVNDQQGIFDAGVATGYPTPSDPYAFPSEINTELVVLHVRPVGS
jgi:peptide/nickel transport system substrate-binding protein